MDGDGVGNRRWPTGRAKSALACDQNDYLGRRLEKSGASEYRPWILRLRKTIRITRQSFCIELAAKYHPLCKVVPRLHLGRSLTVWCRSIAGDKRSIRVQFSLRMQSLTGFLYPMRAVTIRLRVLFALLVIFAGVSCARTPAPKVCLQFSPDLMPTFAGGLTRKDLRVANAWAVKTDKMIDSSGVKFPAYFLSADIIAPSGEAVVGTWVTTEITKGGLIFSVSPQAKKYSNWAQAGDASTAGITMETPGAKESVACVLEGRGGSQKSTTP